MAKTSPQYKNYCKVNLIYLQLKWMCHAPQFSREDRSLGLLKIIIIIIIHYVYRYFISVCLFLACTPSQNLTLENPKEHTTISHYVLMTDLVFLAMFLENRHFLPHGLKVYARCATKEERKTLKLLL